MKPCFLAVLCLATYLSRAMLHAQPTFRNLNFEGATIIPVGAGSPSVFASFALPFWTAYVGETGLGTILYNNLTIGSPDVSIHDAASLFQPLNGNYSVVLQAAAGGNPTASIAQSGQVPADARALIFNAVSVNNLQVTLAGSPLSLVQLGNTPNYSVIGADISSFAGQIGELRFTGLNQPIPAVALDNIRFSSVEVPEPSVMYLFVIGAALCVWLHRRN